jgi:predicted RNA-binding Zn-ribbon protein involved in translation (DUF1610 family)
MTHVCPKCGAVIVVETDDRKYLEKRIEKWRKAHKCKEKKAREVETSR